VVGGVLGVGTYGDVVTDVEVIYGVLVVTDEVDTEVDTEYDTDGEDTEYDTDGVDTYDDTDGDDTYDDTDGDDTDGEDTYDTDGEDTYDTDGDDTDGVGVLTMVLVGTEVVGIYVLVVTEDVVVLMVEQGIIEVVCSCTHLLPSS